MYAVTTTTGRVSGLRKGILFLLALAMMAALFGTVLAAPADAASYKVKTWKERDMHCYLVYQGSSSQYSEPTFCRYDKDVYKSGNMKVSFYWQWDNANAEKADAFWQYLGNKANNSWSAGYFFHPVNDAAGTEYWYYVYKIEGWNCNSDSLNNLLKQSPFKNSNGDKLYLDYVSQGNQLSGNWSDWKCSGAAYFSKPNATIGFRFVDKDGYTIYPYRP